MVSLNKALFLRGVPLDSHDFGGRRKKNTILGPAAACIFTLRSGVASLEPPKFVKVSAVSGRFDARGLGGENLSHDASTGHILD